VQAREFKITLSALLRLGYFGTSHPVIGATLTCFG
jgi:hypothetical protein